MSKSDKVRWRQDSKKSADFDVNDPIVTNFDFRKFTAFEKHYPIWLNSRMINELSESGSWNIALCVMSILALLLVSMDFQSEFSLMKVPIHEILDTIYNLMYGVHCISLLFNDLYRMQHDSNSFSSYHWLWYLGDVASYSHYFKSFLPKSNLRLSSTYILKMTCYYYRHHVPARYLWNLNDYYLKDSVVGTLLKFWYLILMMRIGYTNFDIWHDLFRKPVYTYVPDWLISNLTKLFLRGYYVLDVFFLQLGTKVPEEGFGERLIFLMIIMTGTVMVEFLVVSTMALILAVFMRPEEVFQSRMTLIDSNMSLTGIPMALRDKVMTFYEMYWHKQRAVSVTKLLHLYPPALLNSIRTDIYFEAMQKSVILRDLSYSILSELAKHMITVNYIPGDIIIKRDALKPNIIYITYGDVEVLTADDDETPMLRFTRGTILNPCGGCLELACSKSHVSIRAATFCTAHVLHAANMWRVLTKYGLTNAQAYILRSAFSVADQKICQAEGRQPYIFMNGTSKTIDLLHSINFILPPDEGHIFRVRSHYNKRPHPPYKFKSTIECLKQNLIGLKEARDAKGRLLLDRTDVFLEISACYIMRNRKDSALTEESDTICLRPRFPCIMQPSSSLLATWGGLIALTTLIVTFFHPYCLVFAERTPFFTFFDYMVTFLYILDIIVHLSTGVKIEEGVPVTFRRTSSEQIASVWFLLDFLSVFPFFNFVDDGHFAGLNKLLKIPKVFLFLRKFKDEYVRENSCVTFVAFVLILFILCWLLACVQQAFWCSSLEFCEVKNITKFPYWSNDLPTEETLEVRILYSIYWSLSMLTFTEHKTFVMGDYSWAHTAFIIVLIEFLTLFRVLIKATYAASIIASETMRDLYMRLYDNVMKFLENNDVDPILRTRYTNYMQLLWHLDKAYQLTSNNESYFYDLPQHVEQELSALQRNKFISAIPFMQDLRAEDLKIVCAQAKLFRASPFEILLNTGDISNEVYVIRQGYCEVLDPETQKVVALKTAKGYFADMECLLRIPAYYTVRAVTHVQAFSVSRLTFQKRLNSMQFRVAILHARKTPEYNNLKSNPRESFLKYIPPLPPANREYFPLPRKHMPDSAFLTPFNQLGFLSVLRYVFPRYSLRPDGKYLRYFQLFRALCAILTSFVFPWYTFLELQFDWIYYVSLFLDYSAYFDILQRMLVSYFDEKGILVYHPASTAIHYIKGAFLADLLFSLPFEFLDTVRQTIYIKDNAYKSTSELQILMLNRLGQLYRVPNAMEMFRDRLHRDDVILVLNAFPVLLAVAVVVTTLILELTVTKWRVIDSTAWRMDLQFDYYGNWVINNADSVLYNITLSPIHLILTTFYWVVYEITDTGFNLFQPSSVQMLQQMNTGMMICLIALMYFTVRVISIRSNVNLDLADHQQNMSDLVKFMKKEKMTDELQRESLSHYAHTWFKTRGVDNSKMLKICDLITLRTDAILDIYGETFHKCPILHKCDLSLLRLLGRAMSNEHICKEASVIKRQDVVAHMYIVDYGIVECRDPNDEDMIITALPRGSVFGNLEVVKTVVSPNRFVARNNVHLLKIESSLFYKIVQEFPAVQKLIKQFRAESEGHNYISGGTVDFSGSMYRKGHRQTIYTLEPANKWKLLKFLDARNKGMQLYLIIISLMCVFADSYNAGFQNNSGMYIFMLYSLDVAYIVKIGAFFALPYIAKEGTDSKKATLATRRRYFHGEMIYDLFSLIPFEVLCVLFKYQWTAFSFLRLNRLIRLFTVEKYLKSYIDKANIGLTYSCVATMFVWFTVFIHIIGCMWHILGVYIDSKNPNTSWRWESEGKSLRTKPAKHTNRCYHDYVCAMYFVMTTFTHNGIGNITPSQPLEVLFTCGLMLLSVFMYTIYDGHFTNIMQYRLFHNLDFYSHYLELQDYLKANRVSTNLVNSANKYTMMLWRESKGLQVPRYLKMAPQCLRLDLMSAAYMKHLQGHQLFKQCEKAFRRQLVGYIEVFLYDEDMHVVREGEITNSMYFVHKGRAVECVDEESTGFLFPANTYFGTLYGLNRGFQYSSSFKTVIKSEVLTLKFDDWFHLLQHFPKARQVIYNDPEYKHDEDDWLRQSSLKDGFDLSRLQRRSSKASEVDLTVRSRMRRKSQSPELASKSPSTVEGPLTTFEPVPSKEKPKPFEIPVVPLESRTESIVLDQDENAPWSGFQRKTTAFKVPKFEKKAAQTLETPETTELTQLSEQPTDKLEPLSTTQDTEDDDIMDISRSVGFRSKQTFFEIPSLGQEIDSMYQESEKSEPETQTIEHAPAEDEIKLTTDNETGNIPSPLGLRHESDIDRSPEFTGPGTSDGKSKTIELSSLTEPTSDISKPTSTDEKYEMKSSPKESSKFIPHATPKLLTKIEEPELETLPKSIDMEPKFTIPLTKSKSDLSQASTEMLPEIKSSRKESSKSTPHATPELSINKQESVESRTLPKFIDTKPLPLSRIKSEMLQIKETSTEMLPEMKFSPTESSKPTPHATPKLLTKIEKPIELETLPESIDKEPKFIPLTKIKSDLSQASTEMLPEMKSTPHAVPELSMKKQESVESRTLPKFIDTESIPLSRIKSQMLPIKEPSTEMLPEMKSPKESSKSTPHATPKLLTKIEEPAEFQTFPQSIDMEPELIPLTKSKSNLSQASTAMLPEMKSFPKESSKSTPYDTPESSMKKQESVGSRTISKSIGTEETSSPDKPILLQITSETKLTEPTIKSQSLILLEKSYDSFEISPIVKDTKTEPLPLTSTLPVADINQELAKQKEKSSVSSISSAFKRERKSYAIFQDEILSPQKLKKTISEEKVEPLHEVEVPWPLYNRKSTAFTLKEPRKSSDILPVEANERSNESMSTDIKIDIPDISSADKDKKIELKEDESPKSRNDSDTSDVKKRKSSRLSALWDSTKSILPIGKKKRSNSLQGDPTASTLLHRLEKDDHNFSLDLTLPTNEKSPPITIPEITDPRLVLTFKNKPSIIPEKIKLKPELKKASIHDFSEDIAESQHVFERTVTVPETTFAKARVKRMSFSPESSPDSISLPRLSPTGSFEDIYVNESSSKPSTKSGATTPRLDSMEDVEDFLMEKGSDVKDDDSKTKNKKATFATLIKKSLTNVASIKSVEEYMLEQKGKGKKTKPEKEGDVKKGVDQDDSSIPTTSGKASRKLVRRHESDDEISEFYDPKPGPSSSK